MAGDTLMACDIFASGDVFNFLDLSLMAMESINGYDMSNLSTMLIASIAAPGVANVRELGQNTFEF